MMAAFEVAGRSALEILDSRGRPTFAVAVRLADCATARAAVLSGAPPGSREAVARGERATEYNRLMEIAAAARTLGCGTS
jgi:enolase